MEQPRGWTDEKERTHEAKMAYRAFQDALATADLAVGEMIDAARKAGVEIDDRLNGALDDIWAEHGMY